MAGAVAVAVVRSREGVGHSPASGERHLMAQVLRQHFLSPAQWSSREHSLLSRQGAGVRGAGTQGQRPAFCTGAGEKRPALRP